MATQRKKARVWSSSSEDNRSDDIPLSTNKKQRRVNDEPPVKESYDDDDATEKQRSIDCDDVRDNNFDDDPVHDDFDEEEDIEDDVAWRNATKHWPSIGAKRLMFEKKKFRPTNVPNIDDSMTLNAGYDQHCWSLIATLDLKKCVEQLQLNDGQVGAMTRLIDRLKAALNKIASKAKSSDTVIKLTLPSLQHDNENDDDIVTLICDFDACLRVITRMLISRTDKRSLGDVDDFDHFASLNDIVNDDHMNYLASRIDYVSFVNGGGSGGGTTGVDRYNLRGTFLVSLKEIAPSRKLKFRSWRDMDDNLQRVVGHFITRFMFDRTNRSRKASPIYLNISMRKNTRRFNLLTAPALSSTTSYTGAGGVAAAIEISLWCNWLMPHMTVRNVVPLSKLTSCVR